MTIREREVPSAYGLNSSSYQSSGRSVWQIGIPVSRVRPVERMVVSVMGRRRS